MHIQIIIKSIIKETIYGMLLAI